MRLLILKWLLGKEAFNEIEKETDNLFKKLYPNAVFSNGTNKAIIRKHLLKARYK